MARSSLPAGLPASALTGQALESARARVAADSLGPAPSGYLRSRSVRDSRLEATRPLGIRVSVAVRVTGGDVADSAACREYENPVRSERSRDYRPVRGEMAPRRRARASAPDFTGAMLG